MSTTKRTLSVVTPNADVPMDVVGPLTRGGFAIRPLSLTGTAPDDDAAVLVLANTQADAIAFTRRCRVDSRTPRPLIWLLPVEAAAFATAGFDAGADACLVRPADPEILLAQLNVLLRSYAGLTRVVAKSADTIELSERLAKLFRQADADAALARRTLAAFAPEPVEAEGMEVHWVHAPALHGGLNIFAVRPTANGLRFALTSAGGLAVPVGAAVLEAVLQFLLMSDETPAHRLTCASRRVGTLNLPERVMIGATLGTLEKTGVARVACGGNPPPVVVPVDGGAGLWHGVGAFLGSAEMGYSDITGELAAGDCLLLLAGGAAADKRPDVRAAAEEHRGGSLAEFVAKVAEVVFSPADRDDGFTLLGIGRTSDSSGKILVPTESER